MILSRRTLGAVASLLLLLHAGVAAQAPDPPLEFLRLRAGAPLAELAVALRELGGELGGARPYGRLRCDRAKVDRRVQECRTTISDPIASSPIDVWVSSIDSTAAIIALSANVSGDELSRWRSQLERRYGQVGAQVQGSQWMMQWVRKGRMIRLTWRVEKNRKVASLSLIDGHVLDAWGLRDQATP